MASQELYFDSVSEGVCEVLGCPNPAKYRASWAQGIVVKLVCTAHRTEVEGKLYEDLDPAVFGSARHTRRSDPPSPDEPDAGVYASLRPKPLPLSRAVAVPEPGPDEDSFEAPTPRTSK
jgi:hypothetical protein